MFNLKEKVKELASYKFLACKAGRQEKNWKNFVKDSKLMLTDLNTGDLAEISIMWMLGMFQRVDKNLSVHSAPRLDMEGIDVVLRRFNQEFYIQIKFNKNNDHYYGDEITVVEVGPPTTFLGHTYTKKESGNIVLFKILSLCGAYSEEELYDLFEKEERFEEKIKEAWEWLRN